MISCFKSFFFLFGLFYYFVSFDFVKFLFCLFIFLNPFVFVIICRCTTEMKINEFKVFRIRNSVKIFFFFFLLFGVRFFFVSFDVV